MENKTIKISKESMERFNHDKNVVGITQEELVSCPINNGADLNSDCMLDVLFDDGEYVEYEVETNHFEVLGFIDGAAIIAEYWLRNNILKIKTIHPTTRGLIESYRTLLKDRLTDEQVEPAIYANETIGEYVVHFYYNKEYSAKFNS